ncbi:SAM-dependent methyltransferase [Nocardia noduli]|uniref:SAM-dependent methyltransferase n=1 Tax=Nocardia noduli TaxID=2815722 RepID=UPI001C22A921|nr:SAM-dependent methyltransferase [Nocardia noduli]
MSRRRGRAHASVEKIALVDPRRAHCGRVHDVLLGAGKDSYWTDLQVGERLITEVPEFGLAAQAARMFLARAVHDVAADGIAQIIELGSGYPCSPNLHAVARRVRPSARTIYLDSDPVVAVHGRALLADEQTEFIHADITDTDTIVREIAETIDPAGPVAICFGFVLEFIDDPSVVVEAVTTILPPGSCVVLSHVTADQDTGPVADAAEIYRVNGIEFRPRRREEIAAILSGFDLMEPGLVAVHSWRPDVVRAGLNDAEFGWGNPTGEFCLAAVGRLP